MLRVNMLSGTCHLFWLPLTRKPHPDTVYSSDAIQQQEKSPIAQKQFNEAQKAPIFRVYIVLVCTSFLPI